MIKFICFEGSIDGLPYHLSGLEKINQGWKLVSQAITSFGHSNNLILCITGFELAEDHVVGELKPFASYLRSEAVPVGMKAEEIMPSPCGNPENSDWHIPTNKWK